MLTIIDNPTAPQATFCKSSRRPMAQGLAALKTATDSGYFDINRVIKSGVGGYPALITSAIDRIKHLMINPNLLGNDTRCQRVEGRHRDVRLITALLTMTDLKTFEIRAFSNGQLAPANLRYIKHESGLSSWQVGRGMRSLIKQGLINQEQRKSLNDGKYRSKAAIRRFTGRFFGLLGLSQAAGSEHDKRNGVVRKRNGKKRVITNLYDRTKKHITAPKPIFKPKLTADQRDNNSSKLAEIMRSVFGKPPPN